MNKQALAEDMVELWYEIEEAYVRRYNDHAPTEELIALFEQAMKWRMTKDIEAQRSGVPSKQEKKVRRHSPESDESITEAQAKYIKDLGGKPSSHMTKQEASDYIEELKEG